MMLQFLSKKQINIGFALILLCLIPLQFFTSFSQFDLNVWQHSAPLSHFIFNVLGEELIKNNYFNFITSTILIAIQLILVYNIFNKIKHIDKQGVLATWFYLWLIHLFPSTSSFSPALISQTLIIIALFQFYTYIENHSSDHLFNISILCGIAFLLWYPSILILAFLLIVLYQHNKLVFKNLIIISTSFMIPLIYFLAYYIYQDESLEILYKFSNFHIYSLNFPSISLYQIICLSFIIITIIIGTLKTISFGGQTIKFSRLFINSITSLLIIASLSMFLSINNMVYSILALSFPISLILAYYINIFKRPLFAELAHLSLILLIIINFTLAF